LSEPSILPADFPRLQDVAVDWRVATLALVGAVAASLLFGSLPASLARRLNLVEALTEDSLAPVGASLRTRVSRTRSIIMVGQVAVAALLLVGAALLTRSFVVSSSSIAGSCRTTCSPRSCRCRAGCSRASGAPRWSTSCSID
jgi:hypothetical protein